MTILPPSPFISDSASTPRVADAGASFATAPTVEAPATLSEPIVHEPCPIELAGASVASEAPGFLDPDRLFYVSPPEFSDISNVCEIFHWARKLMEPTPFVLDEQKFMEAIEPLPLFLQSRRGPSDGVLSDV